MYGNLKNTLNRDYKNLLQVVACCGLGQALAEFQRKWKMGDLFTILSLIYITQVSVSVISFSNRFYLEYLSEKGFEVRKSSADDVSPSDGVTAWTGAGVGYGT